MADLFGRYESQTTKQLRQIDSSKYPDTNKDMEANLVRINQFIDYISQYLQTMQKGVDAANKDPLSQMRDTVWNIGALLGGGELLYGIDLGDLQYYLPALGAMFGFDSDTPFPINLFEAVEHFFLGYIVPLDSFTTVIQDLIDGWLIALGIDPDTVQAIHDLLDAIGAVTGDVFEIWDQISGLLDILGISLDGLGPFGDIWHSITQILGGLNLETLGNLVDPVLSTLAPWIHELAVMIGYLDQIIKAFSGGITDLNGILNFAGMFTPFVDLLAGFTDPLAAWSELFTNAILPGSGGGIPFFSDLQNLIPGLNNTGGAFDPQDIWNTIITDFLNPSGLIEAITSMDWGQLLTELTGQAGGLSELGDLLTGGLFGPIAGGRLGTLPLGSIGNTSPNLLLSPSFDTAAAIRNNPDFTFNGVNGHMVPGCAQTTASGATKTLVSNSIGVTEGESVPLSIWAWWSGYTGPANSIRMSVSGYTAAGALVGGAPVMIAGIAAPGAASTNVGHNNFVQMTGTYVVPAGVVEMVMELTVMSTATAGTVRFDDGSITKPNLMPTSFVNGLPTFMSGITTHVQDFIDVGMQALLGDMSTGWTLADWKQALTVFPIDNVTGAGGLPTVRDTFGTMWDWVTGAFQLTSLSGVDLNDLANASQDVSFTSLNSGILAGAHEVELNTRTNNPIEGAMERTAVANFNWTLLGTAATPANFAVTQANSVGALIRMTNDDTKGTFFWRSMYSGVVSGFYINIGKINDTTGVVDHLYQSPNLAGNLTTTWSWDYYQPAAVDRITHANDDGLIMEFQVVGAGTVNIAGLDFAWAGDNFPGAISRKPAITRATAGAHPTLALNAAQFTAALTTKTPWIALGRFDVPITYHPPVNWNTVAAGAFNYPIPAFAQVAGCLIDYWAYGAGGGGQSGGYFVTAEGGARATVISGTLVYGTDIPMGTTNLTGVVADNASGGINPFALDPGANGAATTITSPGGGGFATKSAAGGKGGGQSGNSWGQATGQGAQNATVAGIQQFGGAEAAVNSDGNTPGGGGGSGYPAVGRQGGEGRVFFRARQP